MNLFGADAFSPQALMNASSILNGGGTDNPADPMQKRKRQMDQATGLSGPGADAALKSLFYHIIGQPYGGPSRVTLNARPLQQMNAPNLMSYFGG